MTSPVFPRWLPLLTALFAVSSGCHSSEEEADSQPVVVDLSSPPPIEKPPARDASHAGSESCRECHAEIAARYAHHPMSQSSGVLTADTVLPDHDETASFLLPGGWTYQSSMDDTGQIVHRETKSSPDHERTFGHAERMTMFLGSGRRGRNYLRQAGSVLLLSPMSWQASSERWSLPPDAGRRNPHFERRVTDKCLICHVSQTADFADRKGHYKEPAIVEFGIGCERCHGPTTDHVAWRQQPEDSRRGTDPVTPLGSLPPRQQNSLCSQCHLVGAERVLRYGRQSFDFRPGDDLSDIWLTFATSSTDDGRLTGTSPVEELYGSTCFQQSSGQLTCVTCHDPHSPPSAMDRDDWFRSRCLTCHQTDEPCAIVESDRKQTTKRDSCIVCHMPKNSSPQLFHGSRVNHRIRRRPEAPVGSVFSADSAHLNERFVLFDAAENRVDKREAARSRGLLIANYALADNDALLALHAVENLVPLINVFADDGRLRRRLGQLHALQGDYEAALASFRDALTIAPDDELTLKALGLLAYQMGDHQQGLTALRRYHAQGGWDREATGRLIHLLGLTGQLQEGIAMAEQAITRFPSEWQLHGWLAEAYGRLNRPTDAKRHRDLAALLQSATTAPVPTP